MSHSRSSFLVGRIPALQDLGLSYSSRGISSGPRTSVRKGTAATSPPQQCLFSCQPQHLSVILQKASDLADMINRVIREGLEGLVLKDVKVSHSATHTLRLLSPAGSPTHPVSPALASRGRRQPEVAGAGCSRALSRVHTAPFCV